jgi:hypothetical protein
VSEEKGVRRREGEEQGETAQMGEFCSGGEREVSERQRLWRKEGKTHIDGHTGDASRLTAGNLESGKIEVGAGSFSAEDLRVARSVTGEGRKGGAGEAAAMSCNMVSWKRGSRRTTKKTYIDLLSVVSNLDGSSIAGEGDSGDGLQVEKELGELASSKKREEQNGGSTNGEEKRRGNEPRHQSPLQSPRYWCSLAG